MFNFGDLYKNKIKIIFETTFSSARINAAVNKRLVSKNSVKFGANFLTPFKSAYPLFACTECCYFSVQSYSSRTQQDNLPLLLEPFSFISTNHHVYDMNFSVFRLSYIFIFRVALNCVHNFATMSCRCGPLQSYNNSRYYRQRYLLLLYSAMQFRVGTRYAKYFDENCRRTMPSATHHKKSFPTCVLDRISIKI